MSTDNINLIEPHEIKLGYKYHIGDLLRHNFYQFTNYICFNNKGLPTQDNEHREDALIVFKKFMLNPFFYTVTRIGNSKLDEYENYETVLEE